MTRRSLIRAVLVGAVFMAGSTLAYVLPGEFVLKRAEEQWKGSTALTLQRDVTRPGAETILEQVTLRGGRIKVESDGRTWSWPDEGSNASTAHRPGAIDGLFLQPPGGLAQVAETLGIEVQQVTLDRLPTPDAALPFRPLFRLGGDKAAAPCLRIEKDRWVIRTLQLRQGPDGVVWRAEYDGQGSRKELPGWLPVRIQVYRSGELFESIVLKRSGPARESGGAPKDPAR